MRHDTTNERQNEIDVRSAHGALIASALSAAGRVFVSASDAIHAAILECGQISVRPGADDAHAVFEAALTRGVREAVLVGCFNGEIVDRHYEWLGNHGFSLLRCDAAAPLERWQRLSPEAVLAVVKARQEERERTAREERLARLSSARDPRPRTVAELVTAGHAVQRFILDGVVQIPVEGIVSVFGAPGSGKTALACSLAAMRERGLPFAGATMSRGPTYYIALENRIKTIAALAAAGCEATCVIDSPPPIGNAEQLEAWCGRITGHEPLIFLDTWADWLGANGLDDVSGAHLGVAALRRIVAITGGAVSVLQHTGAAGTRERGHTGPRAASDTMLPLTFVEQGPGTMRARLGTARAEGAKYRHRDNPCEDVLLTFSLQNGAMVLQQADAVPRQGSDRGKNVGGRPRSTGRVLEVLARPGAPDDLAGIAKAADVDQATASRALKELVRTQQVDVNPRGRKKCWTVRSRPTQAP